LAEVLIEFESIYCGLARFEQAFVGGRILGCKQRIRSAVNDGIGIEPNP
jgi:hypothetical protein